MTGKTLGRWIVLGAASAAVATLPGCGALGFGGAMIESYQRTSTKTIEAQYTGLKGKKWAVIVSADRMTQGEFPDLVLYLTGRMTDQLARNNQEIAATGFVPADRLLGHLYDNPSLMMKPRGELAKELGVDRLIVVEILEYRLNDPGNQYLWSGVATGTVGVIEVESALQDQFVFERPIKVQYPNKQGTTQAELSAAAVNSVLAQRFTDRASWLFYKHEEPYFPEY